MKNITIIEPLPKSLEMSIVNHMCVIDTVVPDTSNIIRFHGTLEEFKKYLPELYERCKKNE